MIRRVCAAILWFAGSVNVAAQAQTSIPISGDAVPGLESYDLYSRSVFPGEGTVPVAYGGFYLEAMDSHGGWIASAPDLLKLVSVVDGLPGRADILDAASIAAMTARPSIWADSSYWYGLGWMVRPVAGGANWWHTGSLPGTTTLVVRGHNGLSWAAFFNTRLSSGDGSDSRFVSALDNGMWTAAAAVNRWPAGDLFRNFP